MRIGVRYGATGPDTIAPVAVGDAERTLEFLARLL